MWWDWINIDFIYVNVVYVCGEGEYVREVVVIEFFCFGVWEKYVLVCFLLLLVCIIMIGEVIFMCIYCLF